MIRQAFQLQKTRKYILQGGMFFALFMLIYTIVDGLNLSYPAMAETYGRWLVVTNIVINGIMSFASALLLNLSTAMVTLKGREGKSANFGFFSVLFGILTYGCTTCVIVFLAAVGITFSVIALPLAGFPYKIIALVLIMIGLIWMFHELKHGRCKVDLKQE